MLHRTLRSFFRSSDSPQEIQAIVKIDTDDRVKLDAIPKLKEEFPGLLPVITPRGAGYNDMWRFIEECSDAADARWHFMLDDDAIIHGHGWDRKLKGVTGNCEIGMETFAAQSQYYVLENRQYESAENRPCTPVGLFVPSKFWKRLGIDHISSPADECWLSILKRERWPIKILRGTTYHHNWSQNSPHRSPNYVPAK